MRENLSGVAIAFQLPLLRSASRTSVLAPSELRCFISTITISGDSPSSSQTSEKSGMEIPLCEPALLISENGICEVSDCFPPTSMASSWKTKTIPSEDSRMSNSQYLKPLIPGFAEDSRYPSRVFSAVVPEAPSLCPEFFIGPTPLRNRSALLP